MGGATQTHIFTPRARYAGEEAVGAGPGSPARNSYILSPQELFDAVSTSYMLLTPSADAHTLPSCGRGCAGAARQRRGMHYRPPGWLAGSYVLAVRPLPPSWAREASGRSHDSECKSVMWCACEAPSVVKLVPVRVSCYVSRFRRQGTTLGAKDMPKWCLSR